MKILIKYTLKSMMEKKFRSFLIILAIALAGGLFLASSRLSTNIGDAYYDLITEQWGRSDIDIYGNDDSPSYLVSLNGCKKAEDDIERVIPLVHGGAEYKVPGQETTQYISIQGYNIDDYLSFNDLEVLEGNIEKLGDGEIILSKSGAEQLGVSVGDELHVNINGMRKIKVSAIVGRKGIFSNEQGYITGMMSYDTLSRYMKCNGRADMIHIVVKEGVNVNETIEKLQQEYRKYVVEYTIDMESIRSELNNITQPFMLMTIIVVFMSIFIIYSSFKVIMLEKLPVVGTFRSVGATKGIMNGVLLLEALFYGVIGGIFACILGTGALYVLSNLMASMLMGGGTMSISLDIPVNSYIITFFIGLVMAILSTIIPIMGVSKISLKDIILNNRPHKHRKYLKNTIMGAGFITVGLVVPMFLKEGLAGVSSMIGLFLVIIGMIKVLPIIVLYASQVIGIIFQVVFGNIGGLATKNIKKNSSVLNSITLITIGISILFSISTMTRNVNDQVIDFYKDTYKCEIMGYVGNMDDQKLRILKRNENVERTVEVISTGWTKIPEFNESEIYAEAIQTSQLSPDITYNLMGDEQELLKQLQEDRNIIITKFLKNKYHMEIGDKITFKFKKAERQYTIIGFMDTQWQNGYFALMPLKYLKKDADKKYYDMAYISLKDGANVEEVCAQLEESLANISYGYMQSIEEIAQRNQEQNASMMGMISIFAILAMVIGVIGVVNNLFISFIERRQSIAMLRSVGMSKWQVLKMIFIEGLGSGVISAISGIAGGILTCCSMQYILDAMDMMMKMHLVPELFGSYFIGGMLITVIGSIIPARGSSKLNIIEAIKYE